MLSAAVGTTTRLCQWEATAYTARVRSWLARRSEADQRLLVLAALLAFAAVVQHWYSIADGIRVQFAHDVSSYLVIANAAPSLPTTPVLQPFAERIPVHWLVGVVSNAGVSLDLVYRIGMFACLLAIVVAVHSVLIRIGLQTAEYGLAMAALAASAYPFHYLLASPGMLSDAALVLGVAILLLGFARGRLWIVLLGLALGTAGRQTMIPVAVIAAGGRSSPRRGGMPAGASRRRASRSRAGSTSRSISPRAGSVTRSRAASTT